MNTKALLQALVDKDIMSDQQAAAIDEFETRKPFSVHGELRSVLLIGIILFTSGIGILIYENIESIGHQVIIAAIACTTAGCFYYTFKNKLPYSNLEIKNPNRFSEYALLLGCSTFLALEGYLQFQYQLFGTRYGLAVLIPTIVFFFCAYLFDHRGVLSMAITGLASWLGLSIAPISILANNDFTEVRLVILGILLGLSLLAVGWASDKFSIKKHFSFTYLFLGGKLACIASLVGLFNHEPKAIYIITGSCVCFFFIQRSRHVQSLVFLLMGVIYGYIFITYVLFFTLEEGAAFTLGTFYFLFSSIGVIIFLLNFKKLLGIKK